MKRGSLHSGSREFISDNYADATKELPFADNFNENLLLRIIWEATVRSVLVGLDAAEV